MRSLRACTIGGFPGVGPPRNLDPPRGLLRPRAELGRCPAAPPGVPRGARLLSSRLRSLSSAYRVSLGPLRRSHGLHHRRGTEAVELASSVLCISACKKTFRGFLQGDDENKTQARHEEELRPGEDNSTSRLLLLSSVRHLRALPSSRAQGHGSPPLQRPLAPRLEPSWTRAGAGPSRLLLQGDPGTHWPKMKDATQQAL